MHDAMFVYALADPDQHYSVASHTPWCLHVSLVHTDAVPFTCYVQS